MTDFTLEDTFYICFSTRAFATGLPTTLGSVPVVSAYENDNTTQITAGITLGVDHDGVGGLNLLTVVASAANGYETGKDYSLVITTGTVDGVSAVGEVVGDFTIGRNSAVSLITTVDTVVDGIQTDLDNGTDGLGALKTLIDLISADLDNTTDGLGAILTRLNLLINEISLGSGPVKPWKSSRGL